MLALLPIPHQPLQARYTGPYVIGKKVGDVDYVVNTPGRHKTQRLCHINMLKKYHQRPEDLNVTPSLVTCTPVSKGEGEASEQSQEIGEMIERSPKLKNSDVLKDLQKEKLSHL